jgi:uncharacterized membrane protein YuzA (DUF378 family)
VVGCCEKIRYLEEGGVYVNLHKISFALLVIGGLNWGLVLFDMGVENYIGSSVANIVYALVALSAIYEAVGHKKMCKMCDKGSSM